MKYRQEIVNCFAMHPWMLRDASYHSKLPKDIADWYCYVEDCGHNILALPKSLVDDAFATDNIQGFLAPVAVRTVLRGYVMRDGYVVVDVRYDPFLGIYTPDGDDEY